MNGRQFLLLENFVGDVTDRDNQLTGVVGLDNRRRVDLIVAISIRLKRAGGFFPGGQRRVKGAEIWTHDFWIGEQFIEVDTRNLIFGAT